MPRRREHGYRAALGTTGFPAYPVRAEQADELALAELEVDPVERGHRAVALGEALDCERRSGHGPSLLRPLPEPVRVAEPGEPGDVAGRPLPSVLA